MSPANPYLAEIAMLRSQVETLQAELAILKDDGRAEEIAVHVARIRTGLNVPHAIASMLRVMSDGNMKSVERLWNSYRHPDEESDSRKTVHVLISKARRLLGRDVIVLQWGLGYSLSPEFAARVRALMAGGQQ